MVALAQPAALPMIEITRKMMLDMRRPRDWGWELGSMGALAQPAALPMIEITRKMMLDMRRPRDWGWELW
jgi:hypothetical protein